MPRFSHKTAVLALLSLISLVAGAGAQQVLLDELGCLPLDGNGVLSVRIEPPPPAEVKVRLNFRRQNQIVEDFYYTEMVASGGGKYWGLFPLPEDSEFEEKKLDARKKEETAWAEWWRAKEASQDRDPNRDLDRDKIVERASRGSVEKRDWMARLDDLTLQTFLGVQTTEPTEYFVDVWDPVRGRVASSPQRVVPVRADCKVTLTPQQAGMALNLTVGETAPWQVGEAVFHWKCTGVVTRLDTAGVLRADEACRACVVAWWPYAAGAAAASGLILAEGGGSEGPAPPPPGEVSPSRP